MEAGDQGNFSLDPTENRLGRSMNTSHGYFLSSRMSNWNGHTQKMAESSYWLNNL
jgi:hypothetical protein